MTFQSLRRQGNPHVLIDTLGDLYDINDRRFKIKGDLSFTFSLEDVLFIIGLPIDGQPVIGTKVNSSNFCNIYVCLFRPLKTDCLI